MFPVSRNHVSSTGDLITLKGNIRNFKKLKSNKKIKYYIIVKSFCLNIFFTFLTNFIFVVSHLKIHPPVCLNTSKALTSFKSKRKVYLKFISFCHYAIIFVKKDKMLSCAAPRGTNRTENNSNIITLVTIVIMLL